VDIRYIILVDDPQETRMVRMYVRAVVSPLPLYRGRA
jgi:hypothetical protein